MQFPTTQTLLVAVLALHVGYSVGECGGSKDQTKGCANTPYVSACSLDGERIVRPQVPFYLQALADLNRSNALRKEVPTKQPTSGGRP